jgi:hypothetical protein
MRASVAAGGAARSGFALTHHGRNLTTQPTVTAGGLREFLFVARHFDTDAGL